MPSSKYLRFTISGESVDVESTESIPIAISYKLEDKEDFQKKTSGDSFDISVPATLNNDQIGNTLHNPGVEDMTADEAFKRPRPCVLEANGYELLVGKAFLKGASHDSQPLDYTYDCYGDNADWLIDLKESTLYDFLKHISFPFTKQHITDSWAFDGTSEALPYVFAPVRYGAKMGPNDNNILPDYMKPSISAYWIIYWAFKSLGYRVESQFFNTNYFRQAVMPWTWGSFLFSEGTKQDNLKFLAKSSDTHYFASNFAGFVDLDVRDDADPPSTYDDNGVYTYDPGAKEMRWTYLPAFDFGLISVTFRFVLDWHTIIAGSANSYARVHWYKNGVEDVTKMVTVYNVFNIGNGLYDYENTYEVYQSFDLVALDYITAKIEVFLNHNSAFTGSHAYTYLKVTQFNFEFARVVLGGVINLETYTGLKNWKFLDFLAGIVDAFNLSLKTDPVSKYVVMEPTHPYDLKDGAGVRPGYFNGNYIDWEDKQDLSKKSLVVPHSDGERELLFKFKQDASDGLIKVIQDRSQTTVAAGKYVLPDRFKAGKKEVENRFFSPVMHYDVKQWKPIMGIAPQMVALVPENISNTSRSEAQNTFQPKLCWYKGEVTGVGWTFDGSNRNTFPFMFAVNYNPNGQNDPVFSYSNEKIGNEDLGYVLAPGLLSRFYLQRMANTRNGVYYSTWFKLNNIDVTNLFHREHKIIRGQKWELIEIKNYKPLMEETTACELRKWTPITLVDKENTFPSEDSVLAGDSSANPFDTKYAPLKCLSTDIPQPE